MSRKTVQKSSSILHFKCIRMNEVNKKKNESNEFSFYRKSVWGGGRVYMGIDGGVK